jgi:hypothetical protein
MEVNRECRLCNAFGICEGNYDRTLWCTLGVLEGVYGTDEEREEEIKKLLNPPSKNKG